MRLLLPLFCFLCSTSVYGQEVKSIKPEFIYLDPTPENFTLAMAITNPSPKQVDTVIQMSIEYSYVNEDTCFILGQRAIDISKDHPDQTTHAKALLELGDSYRIFGDVEKGKELLLKGRSLYEQLNFPGDVAYADLKLGALSANQADYETGLNYYLHALKIWENLHDSENIIKPLINIGGIFKNINRLKKAEAYLDKALIWANLMKDDRGKMYVLNNQALVYGAQSIKYEEKVETDSANQLLWRDSTKYWIDKAIQKHNESLEVAKEIKDYQNRIRSLANMVNLLTRAKKYQEAIKIGLEVESMMKELKVVKTWTKNKLSLARAYFFSGERDLAIQYGKTGLDMAKKNHLNQETAEADQILFQVYNELEEFEKALFHYQSYTDFLTQTNDKDKSKAIAEVEEKYQNAQKEKEILALKYANETVTRQRNYLFGGGFLLSVLGIFGFQFNRIRKERNDKIAFAEALIFAQENERKRIARDLHDGVGQSLLLLKKQMEYSVENTLENQEMIAETLEEVRSISRDLHPFQLEKFGLTAAIEEVMIKVANSSAVFLSKEMINIDKLVPQGSQIHIFRTIQEALNNIVKHSEATAARLTVQEIEGEVLIRILDNGKGFDHELAMVKQKSLGLKTMFERIAAIGGKLTIKPGEGKGTVVEVRLGKEG